MASGNFQISFPVLSFCPDLQYEVMFKEMKCLRERVCDTLSYEHLLATLSTFYAGCLICTKSQLPGIETHLNVALRSSDYKNMSFTDHLEHYLDTNWDDVNSFCMDGQPEVWTTEAYAGTKGLCFILNSKDKIFNQQT